MKKGKEKKEVLKCRDSLKSRKRPGGGGTRTGRPSLALSLFPSTSATYRDKDKDKGTGRHGPGGAGGDGGCAITGLVLGRPTYAVVICLCFYYLTEAELLAKLERTGVGGENGKITMDQD